jgi:hypothetical protein
LNPFLGKGVGLGAVRVAGQGDALAVDGVEMVAELVVDEVADCEVELDARVSRGISPVPIVHELGKRGDEEGRCCP